MFGLLILIFFFGGAILLLFGFLIHIANANTPIKPSEYQELETILIVTDNL